MSSSGVKAAAAEAAAIDRHQRLRLCDRGQKRKRGGGENGPLGGDWEGLDPRDQGGREGGREKEEGCVVVVVVDFAMGAFNIKPWAINGQASKRASG